eukprot:Em0015g354a
MGGEAEMVLTSVGVKKKEKEEYEEVMRKLDKHFQVRRNVILERARFNRRDQLDGETAEKYITELYSLVEHCDYGTMTEEMLRDRLVVGIRDKTMSEKLQLDQDLTLEKAKIIIRQREAIHDQAEVLQVGEKMALDGAFTQKKPHQIASNHPERNRKSAFGVNQCLSKTVAEIQPEDVDEEVKMESAFLGGVEAEGIRPWMVQVQVCGVPQKFKIDTGAEVTAISEASFKSCRAGWKLKLSRPKKTLYGPASSVLEVVGEFKGRLSYGNKTTLQSVYVVKNLKVNLLGLPAVIALALVAKVDALSTKPGVAGQFPSLFQGLGSLGEPYQIKLQPDAKPFALFTARHVPLPLRDKVKQELEKMVDLGVISKVDVPTPWCAGMVVASKKNGGIHICIDFKLLNNYVQREVHPLPKVDDVLAQLAGAKILEGLDGVLCQMDDVLLFGKNKEEHDVRLRAALEKLEAAGVTLNEEKCEFEKSRLLFLGHIIDEQGIHADPNKTASIKNMKPLQNVSELRQFLGAVLLQEKDSVWKPVSYASRSMSETERRYAQIEKEALAVTWAYMGFRKLLGVITYSSEEFSKFAAEYNFYHETSSPHFAQSNGQAERTVQTMKNLLRESTDPYMALLTYRSTPLPWCGLSPAELLMGRCLRTNLPQVVDRLKPTWQYIERFRKKDKEFKDEQKRHYDQRHKCRPLPDIPDGSKVWVMDGDIPTPATVTHQVEAPRSYTVETEKGTIRRNRYHLKAVPPVPDPEGGTLPSSTEAEKMVAGDQRNQIYQQTETTSPPHRIMTRSRTGTAIRPPDRY